MAPERFKPSYASLTGLKVLVVEDHNDSRELLVTLLEALSAKAIPAANASVAFELMQRHQPDVIVSDIGLPDEDGIRLIRRIRSLPSSGGGSTPAVALTAFSSSEDRRRILAGGFHAYLTKPVDMDQFLQTVVEIVGRATPAR